VCHFPEVDLSKRSTSSAAQPAIARWVLDHRSADLEHAVSNSRQPEERQEAEEHAPNEDAERSKT